MNKANHTMTSLVKSLILLMLGTLTIVASAEPKVTTTSAGHLDYPLALKLAKEHHPDLAIAKQQVKQAGLQYSATKSQLRPQVNLAATINNTERRYYGRDIRESTFFDDASATNITVKQNALDFDNGFSGVQLNWTLLDAKVQQELGKYSIEEQRLLAVANQTEQEITLNLTQTYIEALQADTLIEQSKEQEALFQQQLAGAREQLKHGMITEVEVQEAEANLLQAQAMAFSEKARQQTAYAKLRNLIGDFTSLKPFPSKLINKRIIQKPLADIEASLEQFHPSIQAAKLAITQAQKEKRKTESSYFPTIKATASYGRQNSTTDSLPEPVTSTSYDTSWGLEFSLPLYTSGNLSAQRELSLNQLSIAEKTLEKTRLELLNQVRESYWNAKQYERQLLSHQSMIQSAQSKLNAAEEGKAFGVRTENDVLEAMQNLMDKQTEYIRAEYQLHLNLASLYLLAGFVFNI